MPACASSASEGLVHGVLDSVDCHVRVLVHDSYAHLFGPGTLFATAFTALLTIYVGLLGYQMLLGRGGATLMRMPAIALKIGVIMALLTSWAAYQSLVFGLLFDGPREITAALTTPLRFAYPDLEGDLYTGVEQAYATLAQAAGVYGGQASPNANILQGGPMLGAGLLWLSAGGVLLSTVGLLLACKVVLGFLLAIGPIFIGLYMFETTRGLFDGWLRTTLAVALAPLAANVFGMAMLIMLHPFLGALAEDAVDGSFDMGPIMTIGVIVTVFAAVLLTSLRVAGGMASGFASAPGRIEPRGGQGAYAERELAVAAGLIEAPATSPAPAAAPSAGAPDVAVFNARRLGDAAEAGAPSTPVAERLGQRRRRLAQPMARRESKA